MSEAPAEPSSSPRPPLLTFLVWSAAVLAYPACYLAGIASDTARLQAVLYALPTLAREGFLRLYLVLLSGTLWAVATGAGMAILRRAGYEGLTLAERAIFGGGLGLGICSLATFLLGTVSGQPAWLLPVLCWGLLLALACLGARDARDALAAGARGLNAWRRQASVYSIALAALGTAIVLFALTRANVPVIADYDSLEYHLAAPAQWWSEGHITFLRDLVYTNFPQNTEMLFLLAMNCFGGPIVGTVVGLQVLIGFVVLAAAAVAACGRRLGSPEAGRAGAALLLTTPLLAELVTLNSYVVELPLTAYGFLALYAFLLLHRAPAAGERWRCAVLCGAMAGLAVGCKYTALVFVLAPIGLFVLGCGVVRLRTLRRAIASAALIGAVALAVASPWFIRNAVNTGNPTYPLLYDVFGGRNWTPEQEAEFTAAHRPSDLRFFGLARRCWTYGVWRDQPKEGWMPPASPILLLLALVPIALADRRSTHAVFLGATLFLLVAAAGRFAPDSVGDLPSFQEASNIVLSVSILAIATAPAFLVHSGAAVFLALDGVFCLLAWYVMTHRLDRFLDPVSPAIALLGGLGVAALAVGRTRAISRGLVAGGLAFTLATSLLIHAPVVWLGLDESQASFLRQVSEGSTYSPAAVEAINKLPDVATVLFVGESRTFYCRRRVLASSVFDRGPIERLLEAGGGRSTADGPAEAARRVRDGLRALGVTHVYVNWPELSRLAGSYSYRYNGREHKGLALEVYVNLITAMTRDGFLHPIGVFGSGPPDRPRPDFVIYALR